MMIRNMFCLLVAMMFSSVAFSAPQTNKKTIEQETPAFVCKGQAEDDCATTDKCLWVQGFERSDGIQVNSYCRKSMRKKVVDQTKKKTEPKIDKSAESKKSKTNKAKPKIKVVNARVNDVKSTKSIKK